MTHLRGVQPPAEGRGARYHDGLNIALPCRISVYTEAGVTRIGMIRPGAMLASLSADPSLREVAQAVEASTKAIIEAAAA